MAVDDDKPDSTASAKSTQSYSSPTESSGASSSTTIASGSLGAAKAAVLPLNGEVAHLFSAYASGVATWMDIFDHNRSYQLEVLRRCLTSSLLRICVCAFTAKQLSLLPSGGIWSVSAANYYGHALRLLIQHLDNSTGSTPGDTLTANILLASYEMLEEHGQKHERHLQGAFTLVRMQGIDAQHQGMDRANFWIYVRHDITIALENKTVLHLSPRDWNVEWRPGETEEDALANQLLWLVARAVDAVYAPDQSALSTGVLHEIRSDAAAWFNDLPLSFIGLKYGDADDVGLMKTYFAVPSAGECLVFCTDVGRNGSKC